MYFVVFATDKLGTGELRAILRPQHRRHLREPGDHPVRVLLGGPTLSDDESAMNGTVLVIEAGSLAVVQAFVADDPYMRAEMFSRIEVRPWDWSLGQPNAETLRQVSRVAAGNGAGTAPDAD